MTSSTLQHKAAHEAGHALMVYLRGDRNVEIRVDVYGWFTVTTQAPWSGTVGAVRTSLKERYLLVCAAGEAGEIAILGNALIPQVAMVRQGLSNDAARFLIAWQGDHAIYGPASAPAGGLVNRIHMQFNQTSFAAAWTSYINQCVQEFRKPAVTAALNALIAAALAQQGTNTPVSSTDILTIAQQHGL